MLTGDHAFSNDYAGLGAYYSTDDGNSWHHASGIPDGGLSFQVAVDPTNSNRLYAATGVGLYRSDDAGRSWENVKLPTGDCAGDSFKANCFFANIVTSVQVQAADKHGHKGGAVAAAVGWRAGQKENFAGKPRRPTTASTCRTRARPDRSRRSLTAPASRRPRSSAAPSSAPRREPIRTRATSTRSSNAKYFNDGNDLGDPDVPGCDPLIGAVCPASGSVVDGVYSSSDFGKTWKVMEGHQQLPTTSRAARR